MSRDVNSESISKVDASKIKNDRADMIFIIYIHIYTYKIYIYHIVLTMAMTVVSYEAQDEFGTYSKLSCSRNNS